MPLLTQSIPNLIGGVSQQAPAIRGINQCESMINCFPSAVEGLVKRSPTSKIFELRDSSNAIYAGLTKRRIKPHLVVRDSTTKYLCVVHPAAVAADAKIEVYDLNGSKKTVYYDTGARDYLTGFASYPDVRDKIKMMTVADVTFVANIEKTVALAADKSTAINYDRIALVYIKQSGDSRETEIIVSDTNGSNAVTVSHKTASSSVGTDHAAEALASALNGAGPAGALYTATSSDSVIKITRGSDFKITVDDDFGGQGAVLIREEVQRFEDLPATAPHDHVVKVVGVPESGLDDYYVKFVCVDGSGFTKGVWQETIAPDIKYKYDYTTMPHILIRQSDGTFMFKKADGGTPGSNVPAGADYSAFQWDNRLVGDDFTNSSPSFVGSTISNLVLFKNRLGFLSGENIILSETSEFFNFWRTTVLDLPDSDPIDISSSSPKVGKIRSAVQFNTELILFTDSGQLVLRGGEILSPKSVALLNVGDYENYSDVDPVSSGLSVFFSYARGGGSASGYSGIREMIPQPNIDGSYVVNSITEVVPNYLYAKPVHIAATTKEDMALVIPTNDAGGSDLADTRCMYLYKYIRNNESVLQAAWFKYEFPDAAAGSGKFASPIWADFVDNNLYVLLIRDQGVVTLEKMRIGTAQDDKDSNVNSNWVTHLDARQLMASGTGSYNATTGLTTWTLPKPYSYYAGLSAVYTTNGNALTVTGGTAYVLATDTAGTVVARGNYSSTAVWLGYKYEMSYEFSQFWLLGRAGRGESALQSGRYQLRNLSLLFEDTSFFKVQVTSGDENSYEYAYSGTLIASSVLNQIYLNRGTFRVPIYGRNTTTKVKILNDTALPCKLLGAEVEAEYTDRATRYA